MGWLDSTRSSRSSLASRFMLTGRDVEICVRHLPRSMPQFEAFERFLTFNRYSLPQLFNRETCTYVKFSSCEKSEKLKRVEKCWVTQPKSQILIQQVCRMGLTATQNQPKNDKPATGAPRWKLPRRLQCVHFRALKFKPEPDSKVPVLLPGTLP